MFQRTPKQLSEHWRATQATTYYTRCRTFKVVAKRPNPAMIFINLALVTLLLLVVACSSADEGAEEQNAANVAAISPTDDLADGTASWSEAELAILRSLWLGRLPPLLPDPSNAVADAPLAASLGQRIFFDTRFSANGEISCATCHKPAQHFTDGLPLAQAIGVTLRSTPTIVGSAYSPWFFWDGRRDSQWAQALTPLEALVEHGGTRTQYVHLVSEDEAYRTAYEAVFGPLPDLSDAARFPASAGPFGDEAAQTAWASMTVADQGVVNRVYANLGKAIAAYERLIMPGPSRFDAYVEALLAGDVLLAESILTPAEIAGLRLFIGPGQCTRCHNGPLFTNHDFHNINVPTGGGLPLDYGRMQGVVKALQDEFNCVGDYSDADADACLELRFVKREGIELPGAFKVPSLRNVAETAPYMHAGQFKTLREVVDHYNQAKMGPLGHNELTPLNFSETQLAQLVAFLQTLSGDLAVDESLLSPPQ